MSTSDKLLKKMFFWIQQRELCVKKLNKAAQELEAQRKKCNAECVGSKKALVGYLLRARLVTLFTGGRTAPPDQLLGAEGVCSGAGVCLSVGTKITEHFFSSDTMKQVEEIQRKSNKIENELNKLIEKLRSEKKQELAFPNPDDLKQHITAEILNAMARKLLCTHEQRTQPENCSNPTARNMVLPQTTRNPDVVVAAVDSMVSCFTLRAAAKEMVKKRGNKLIKEITKTGLRTVLKGGALSAGEVVMIVFELPDAMESWKKLIQEDHVTEASQSIRKAAEDLQQSAGTMKRWLNSIKSHVENVILMDLAPTMFGDKDVSQWMTQTFQSGALDKLEDMICFLKERIDEEEKKDHGNHVDITFSAHGAITDPMIPAKCLLPLSTIEDVVLYSPWNCILDVDAVYAVAAGIMKPQDRVFECCAGDGCEIPDERHQPKQLPDHWNSMKEAGDKLVPNIILSPLKPEEKDLETFQSLKKNLGLPERNRILIPYDPPAGDKSLGDVPFYVVSLALSLVLLGRKFTATLHLPTCLEDQSAGKKLDKEYLRNQYACTIDHTLMRVNTGILKKMTGFPFSS